MLFLSKKATIVALFVGVFILMINSCESTVPTQSVDESETLQETVEDLNQKSKSSNGRLLKDVFQELESGIISKSYFTEKMRKFLSEKGIDPEQVRSSNDIPDNVKLLRGKAAWNEFMEDMDKKDKGIVETSSLIYDPENSNNHNMLLSLAEAASTKFEVVEVPNTPANGSVTVKYLGVQVTTNYSSTWNKYAVANTISSNINNNSNIQLTATVNGAKVTVTEKRSGCQYNGNKVYVSHTNGTHISVNNDTFYMAEGHDGEGWCPPPPPPPITVSVGYGSFVNTNSSTGVVQMGSYSWASANLYYISVSSHSYQDGILITDQLDEHYNDDQAAAGLTTIKNPASPSIFWQQYGQHVWWFHPDDEVIVYDISYKWKNF